MKTPKRKQKEKEISLTGNHNVGYKPTNPKPKDWAFVLKSEGRKGKTARAKVIKLKEEIWDLQLLQVHLLNIKAGLPECKWMITCASPNRELTPSDYLRLMYANGKDEVYLSYNNQKRVLNILEIPKDILG